MRDVEFNYATKENGLMNFRASLPLSEAAKGNSAAADGQMGCVMKIYRDWQLSGDDEFLQKNWGQVKKVLAYAWTDKGWDGNQDGIMEGSQHNTMDVNYFGPNPQMPAPAAGERLIVTGKWTAHATYGRQLEAEFLERLLPDSTAEICAYLSSRAVRGVGPKTAEKIVAAFGTDSLKILETAPERLTEIDGISRKKALEIGASFRQQVAVRRLIEFLAGYRIPAQVAVRLYRVYGAQSLERVQEDPYLLAQPQFGAGFGAADQLALELGFDGDDARRVEAGVIFELRHNLTNGHTFLPQDKLVAATSQLLSLEAEPVIAAVDRLTELGRVEHSTIAGIAAVYLPEYYEAETAIAARIRAMAQHPPAPLPDAERVLQGIEAIAGITYAERQRDAIRMAAERRIMILTGGPGTGKTTVLSGILTLFSKLGRKTLLAAPTGRAAKRLSELTGRDAATVHRLLEAQVSPENGEMFFARNEDEPLECDAVIVDEMSMVDVLLMHSLLEALPQEACLVLVGDPDQLPSVGAGNLFSDLIRSGIVPSVCLTEIFRQEPQKHMQTLNTLITKENSSQS